MADQREILEELNRASRNLGSANAQFAQSASTAAGSAGDAIDSLRQLGSGAIQFSRALTNGQEGMSKYGAAIGQAADGLGGLAQMAGGPLMFVLGGLIKVVGAVVGAVLEQNDTIIKGYDKIADIGGAASFTTESLKKLAVDAAFTVESGMYTKFIDNMTKVGGDFLGLGATAGEGMKNFAEIATVGPTVRGQFNKLGINQDKLMQIQAQYVATQLKIGGLQNKNNAQLQSESIEYATQLVELSAATGQSVDQLAKNRDEDMKDVAYNIRLREIGATADGAAMSKRMQDSVDTAALFGNSARKAVRDVMATGQLITPEAIALNQQFSQAGLSLTKSTEDLRNNRLTQDQFNMQMRDAERATREKMGSAMMLGGTEISNVMGYSSDTMAGASKEMREGNRDQIKIDTEAAKNRVDAAKDNQNALNDTTIALSKAFDKFISLISGAVNQGFKALMLAFKALTKGILGFLTKFDSVFSMVGAGGIDQSLPYMFDSLEDLVKQQKESAEQLAKIEQQKATLKKTGKITGDPLDVLDDRVEKKLRQQQSGINTALQQLLGLNATTPAAVTTSSGTPSAPLAAPAAAPTAAPKTTPSGAGTTSSPTQKFDKGGIARHPLASMGPSPTGDSLSISLPGGRSIATTLDMPADLTSKRESLLTQTESIDRILSGYTANLTAAVDNVAAGSPSPSSRSNNNDLIGAIAYRMDELLSKMKDNTGLQSELLALSKR